MADAQQWEPAADTALPGRHEIELRMLAVRDHVSGLRALIADWALRQDHDLDFVDDVRLAVDEVCAIMLANCSPEDVLTVRLMVSPVRVEIDACVPLPAHAEPSVGGLSLSVLQALAETLHHGVETAAGRQVLRLCFSRAPARSARP